MKTLILQTTKYIYEVKKNIDDTLLISNQSGPIKDAGLFIKNMLGIDGVLSRCVEFDGTLDDFVKADREKKEIQRESHVAEMAAWLDKKHENDNEAQKLYRIAIDELRRNPAEGWSICDMFFLSDNALSKVILAKIGSFTVTPYDDGAIIIKSKGKSYSNNRRFAKAGFIDDLLG